MGRMGSAGRGEEKRRRGEEWEEERAARKKGRQREGLHVLFIHHVHTFAPSHLHTFVPSHLHTPLKTLTFRSHINVPAETLFAWHERPGAFERLAPPWADVRLVRFEGIRDGDRATIHLGAGPSHVTWTAEHRDYVEGRHFRDVQVQGPFKHWVHTHRVKPNGDGASYLEDHIAYALPLGPLGDMVDVPVRKELERQFAYRHRITQQDLAAHRRYAGRPLRVAISGASGLIGSKLSAFLTSGGHDVVRLVRRRPTGEGEAYWNWREGAIEREKLEGLDAVVHLAGESVFALRWSEAKKQRIYASRARGTAFLSQALAALDRPPRVLLSASGVGIYGDRGREKLTETSVTAGHGFLAAVCRDWERATEAASRAGIRTVHLRIGVVLSPEGGALRLMLPAFRLGLGGTAGDRGHYLPWIAIDDVLQGIYHVLYADGIEGPVNLASPQPATMETFVQTLARVLGRPAFVHLPTGLVRLVAGEAADEYLLTSARVLPERLETSGYDVLYPNLEEALRHQLGKTVAQSLSARLATSA